jgi:hypothetical protein
MQTNISLSKTTDDSEVHHHLTIQIDEARSLKSILEELEKAVEDVKHMVLVNYSSK